MLTARILALATLLALTAAPFAHAADGADRPHGDAPPGPPPLDTKACTGKSAGDSSQTTLPDGKTLKGTCQLVFVPERPAMPPK